MVSFSHETTAEDVVSAFGSSAKGRVFVITGTSANGLGAYTATSLARCEPSHLVLVSRTKSKVDPVIEEIASIDSSIRTTFIQCELSDLDSVRKAATQIDEAVPRIDVLVNNAGVMLVEDLARSPQGFEITLASNHIGHFLLTNLVVPKIKAAGQSARIVNVSSVGYKISPFKFDDYNFETSEYDGWTSYGQSKTANILFTIALAKRGTLSYAVHPGSIYTTGLSSHITDQSVLDSIGVVAERNTGRSMTIDPPKSLAQGAATQLRVALDSGLVKAESGKYFKDCEVEETLEYVNTENAERLWKLSEELVGETFQW